MAQHNHDCVRMVVGAVAAALLLLGTAAGRQVKATDRGQEFDKVDYLFGPTARTTRDHVGGEVATGKLQFDSAGRVLAFVTTKGPNLAIPYAKIQDISLNDQSIMRAGAAATGALAFFLHQHKHFMQIHYADKDGNKRTALFQLDKGNYQEIGSAASDIARAIEERTSSGAADQGIAKPDKP